MPCSHHLQIYYVTYLCEYRSLCVEVAVAVGIVLNTTGDISVAEGVVAGGGGDGVGDCGDVIGGS